MSTSYGHRWMRALVVALALALLPAAQALAQQAQTAPLDRWLGQLGRPYVIGIAGDSGSGKSTFAENLQKTLGPDRVKIICVDDYHRLDRQGRKAAGVTALNPVATDLARLARDIGTLRTGKSIMKPRYDHSNGTIAMPEPFAPGKIIIVEGLHPFATAELRKQIDLAVYFDPTSRVKEAWKIKRDVEERGHSLQALRKEMRERKPDFRAYVEPQRALADVLVHFDRSSGGVEDLAVKLREQNLQPTDKRIRVNQSGADYVLRAERRRDGRGVVTIDGKPPETAMARESALLSRISGVAPVIERKSETLDVARLLVAKRVVREIARAGRDTARPMPARAQAARLAR